MTSSLIQIKYSTATEAPQSLTQGELAYSQLSGKLFIGGADTVPVEIAGASFVALLGSVDAAVAALQTLVGTHGTDIDALKLAVTAAEDEIAAIKLAAAQDAQNLTNLAGVVEQNRLDTEAAAAAAATAADTALTGAVGVINARIDGVDTAIAGLQDQITNSTGSAIAALEQKDLVLQGEIDSVEARVDSVEGMLNGSSSVTFVDLTVSGNLVVQGTTTTVDSDVTTIKDPVITLGHGTSVADGNDRGIEYKYFGDGAVKTGFFGLDASAGKFKYIPEVLNHAEGSNVFEGDAGTIIANVEGSATSFAADQVIDLGGEAIGTVSFNGTAAATLSVAVVGFSAAEPGSVVRRDSAGVSGFTAVHTASVSQMAGIDGLVGQQPSGLTNFVINGGTF